MPVRVVRRAFNAHGEHLIAHVEHLDWHHPLQRAWMHNNRDTLTLEAVQNIHSNAHASYEPDPGHPYQPLPSRPDPATAERAPDLVEPVESSMPLPLNADRPVPISSLDEPYWEYWRNPGYCTNCSDYNEYLYPDPEEAPDIHHELCENCVSDIYGVGLRQHLTQCDLFDYGRPAPATASTDDDVTTLRVALADERAADAPHEAQAVVLTALSSDSSVPSPSMIELSSNTYTNITNMAVGQEITADQLNVQNIDMVRAYAHSFIEEDVEPDEESIEVVWGPDE